MSTLNQFYENGVFDLYRSRGVIRDEVRYLLRLVQPDLPRRISPDELLGLVQRLMIGNGVGGPVTSIPEGMDVDFVFELLTSMGFVDGVTRVKNPRPCYGVYPIAPIKWQRPRLWMGNQLWSSGQLQPQEVILMSGGALDPGDSVEMLTVQSMHSLPTWAGWNPPKKLSGGNAAATRLVWKQSHFARGMDLVVPKHVTLRRGKSTHVENQVEAWLDQRGPKPGSVVIYSVQPYATLDHMVWGELLGAHGFTVECVALSSRASSHDLKDLLDAFARVIDHELRRRQKLV